METQGDDSPGTTLLSWSDTMSRGSHPTHVPCLSPRREPGSAWTRGLLSPRAPTRTAGSVNAWKPCGFADKFLKLLVMWSFKVFD